MTTTRTLTTILAAASFAFVAAIILGVLLGPATLTPVCAACPKNSQSIYDKPDRICHN
jgi:hypothetical protein